MANCLVCLELGVNRDRILMWYRQSGSALLTMHEALNKGALGRDQGFCGQHGLPAVDDEAAESWVLEHFGNVPLEVVPEYCPAEGGHEAPMGSDLYCTVHGEAIVRREFTFQEMYEDETAPIPPASA